MNLVWATLSYGKIASILSTRKVTSGGGAFFYLEKRYRIFLQMKGTRPTLVQTYQPAQLSPPQLTRNPTVQSAPTQPMPTRSIAPIPAQPSPSPAQSGPVQTVSAHHRPCLAQPRQCAPAAPFRSATRLMARPRPNPSLTVHAMAWPVPAWLCWRGQSWAVRHRTRPGRTGVDGLSQGADWVARRGDRHCYDGLAWAGLTWPH